MFYDAHIHKKGNEAGGFIIGIEGRPLYNDLYNNAQAITLHDPDNNYISFLYLLINVTNSTKLTFSMSF